MNLPPKDCVGAVLPNKLVLACEVCPPNKEVLVVPKPGDAKLVDGLPNVEV